MEQPLLRSTPHGNNFVGRGTELLRPGGGDRPTCCHETDQRGRQRQHRFNKMRITELLFRHLKLWTPPNVMATPSYRHWLLSPQRFIR